jgi:hypothetical protein
MPNYRSLVPGGFFSATPTDKSTGPVSIRMNNPGAINGASWEPSFPGFVMTVETTPGNKSTVFEAPEFGVGAWWTVLRNYRRDRNVTTVGGIISTYGGGQDYSAYLQFVLQRTGFTADTVMDINDDQNLLKLGLAQFRFEAGKTPPWSNDQILFGIRGARAFANTGVWPASPPVGLVPSPGTPTMPVTPSTPSPIGGGDISNDLLDLLKKLIAALAVNTPPQTVPNPPGTGPVVVPPPPPDQGLPTLPPTLPPFLSSIDMLFGGPGLVGYKTLFGVLGYVLVSILKTSGAITAGSSTSSILTVLTLAFAGLGGLAKVDRMTQAMGTIAAKK